MVFTNKMYYITWSQKRLFFLLHFSISAPLCSFLLFFSFFFLFLQMLAEHDTLTFNLIMSLASLR